MGFLCAYSCVVSRRKLREIVRPEAVSNHSARRGLGFRRNVYAVGSHIGDQASLIEVLGRLIGSLWLKGQAARCFLLQCTGGKWGRGVLANCLLPQILNLPCDRAS